jgi:hypothetical protein
MLGGGRITAADMELLHVCDEPDEIVEYVQRAVEVRP